jgi:hypothetical protein
MLPITAFKRQKGKCITCSQPILTGQRLAKGRQGLLDTVRHQDCPPPLQLSARPLGSRS